MGLFDDIKGAVGNVVDAGKKLFTGDFGGAASDLLGGHTELPPTPQNPQEAQSLIDKVIGHQPGDDQILANLKTIGMLSNMVQVPQGQQATLPYEMPYATNTAARLATNNGTSLQSPLVLANKQLQAYIKENPRVAKVYLRNFDPMNKVALPMFIQQDATQHPGLLTNAKNIFTDVLGRPIGSAMDMMRFPSQYTEQWYGNHFVFNDVKDPSLRSAMSRQAYAYTLNLADPQFTQLAKAKAEAQHIEEDLKLTGPSAASAYEKWLTTGGGNPGLAAHFADFAGQVAFDPLWLLPTDAISNVAKGVAKTALGTEDVGRLFRLIGPGRGAFADATMKDILTMPEVTWRTGALSPAAARGPASWIWEAKPAGAADEAAMSAARFLAAPLARATNIDEMEHTLAQFGDMIRNGKVSDAQAQLFGANALEDRGLVSLAAHTKSSVPLFKDSNLPKDVTEGILQGIDKWGSQGQLAKYPLNEVAQMVGNHAIANAREIVNAGQSRIYYNQASKLITKVGNTQKQWLAMLMLDRPSMAVNVIANNIFTYFWTAARHPLDIGGVSGAAKTFAHSIGAELRQGDGSVPEEFANIFKTFGLEPSVGWRMAASDTYMRELSSRAISPVSRLDRINSLEDAAKVARQQLYAPINDIAPRGAMRYIKWPLTIASRFDRGIRAAMFPHALQEQASLVLHSEDGLIPKTIDELVARGLAPDQAAKVDGYLRSAIHNWALTPGNSITDAAGLRAAWESAVGEIVKGLPHTQASPYSVFRDWMASRGMPPEAASLAAKDYEPVFQRLQRDILQEGKSVPQMKAEIDTIAHSYWQHEAAIAHMTNTVPILRPISDYQEGLSVSHGLSNLQETMRSDMVDFTKHVDRYLATAIPDWEGSWQVRRKILNAATDMIDGRLSRLEEIARNEVALKAGMAPQGWDRAQAWDDYWNFYKESMNNYRQEVVQALNKLHTNAADPMNELFDQAEKVLDQHLKIVGAARKVDTPQAWYKAGVKVSNLYEKNALERAALMGGIDPNEEIQAVGLIPNAAPHVRAIEEYLNYFRNHVGVEMADAATHGGSPLSQTAADFLHGLGDTVVKNGPTMANTAISNAMYKTDLVRMNYSRQYGWDAIMQMFSPFEVFGTRTAFNNLIRTWQMPGAMAAISMAVLNPIDYAKQYGYTSGAGRIPIPLPGLQSVLQHIPFIGNQIKNANFGNVYWVDPLSAMFPMTHMLNTYNDQAKTATPGGLIANWFQSNTPLGLSPFAQIIGGVSGILPRDAWTSSMFSGGPFGVPLSATGQLAMRWFQTGDPTGVPPDEQANMANYGVFSWGFLKQILGFSNNSQFDQYRQDRAVATLVAEGRLTADQGWAAMKTHSGPGWQMAVKEANSEKFLSDFTGAIGFRVAGNTKGYRILLGEKALYSKAADAGTLSDFYTKYPEYSMYKVATKGLQSEADKAKQLDTELYYRLVEKYVNQPYKQSIQELSDRISAINNQSNITESDQTQLSLYYAELDSIRNQQDVIRQQVANATPNRQTSLSLYTPPQERAQQAAANDWYTIRQKPGETYPAFQARQQAFLDSFPAATPDTSKAWTDLFSEYLTTMIGSSQAINISAQNGDYTRMDALIKARDAELVNINQRAHDNLTRQDVERYLASLAKPLTPAQQEFDQAKTLYDTWMTLVSSKNTLLSSTQKAEVSAYYRSVPLLQKHYNVSTVPLNALTTQQRELLAQRDDILKYYKSLPTVDAQIDYMKQHGDLLNTVNQMLGLPKMDIFDFRPPSPAVPYGDPYHALLNMSMGGKSFADVIAGASGGADPVLEAQAAATDPTMTANDLSTLLDQPAGTGY